VSLSASPSLLLVQDDRVLSRQLQKHLSQEGFEVRLVSDVEQAEEALQKPFELLLVDLNLRGGGGADLCRRVRPYLRLDLLRSSVDAYLSKPLDLGELSATLVSVLRRTAPHRAPLMPPTHLPLTWRLHGVQQTLVVPSKGSVELSNLETILLVALFERPDRFIERQDLLAAFSGRRVDMNGPRLETLVSRLRQKVFLETGLRLPLRAWYGRGYGFKAYAELI
jgi:DNA-binding response OmpR family regulator